ncbi:DMT family transporter [Megalodesulfovibrio paquesii]
MPHANNQAGAFPLKEVLTSCTLFLTAIIWGGTFIAGRLLSQEVAPFTGALLRFLAASVVLLAVLLWQERRLPRISRSLLLPLLGLGATGVFAYNILFLTGLKTVPAGRAALIVAINPVAITLLSRLFFKEPLTPAKITGVVLCLTGAATVIGHGNPAALLVGDVGFGELAILGCVLSWTSYTLLGKTVLGRLSALQTVTISCVLGMLMLLPFSLAEDLPAQLARLSITGWSSVLFLGALGTGLGFVWFYKGVQAIGPSRAAVFINFVPVSAAVMGVLLLHEHLELSVIAGGLLVLAGVALTNMRRMKPAEAKG